MIPPPRFASQRPKEPLLQPVAKVLYSFEIVRNRDFRAAQ
jgi:hypothetical protein